MDKKDYSLLTLSVWLIGSNLANGWFEFFATGMAVLWTLIFFAFTYADWRDSRHKDEWQETWHR